MSDFQYQIQEDKELGQLIQMSGQGKSVTIAPEWGFNMICYKQGEENILDFRINDLKSSGFTSIPVLYPTPNRVKNGEFSFEGTDVVLLKKQEDLRVIHGLVYDEKWNWSTPVVEDDGIEVAAWLDFEPGNVLYKAFPWKHRVTLVWRLDEKGIKLTYKVKNEDEKKLPYGFAIHPYFPRTAFGEKAEIRVTASQVYERMPDCFPTGKILDVAGTEFDLHEFQDVNTLDLDDVYLHLEKVQAEIAYGAHKVVFSASENFDRMVVYTPKGREYFCLENQTCMTNAHRFYAEGYKETGLQIVEPQGEQEGYIRIDVE